MKKGWLEIISGYLEVEPKEINSNLVSAQNRPRIYWTNWDFPIPDDKNKSLESILENKVNPKYWLSQKEKIYMDREVADGRTHWDFMHHSDTDLGKSQCIVSNFYKGVPYNVLIDRSRCYCNFWSCDFAGFDDNFCELCTEGNNYQGNNDPTRVVRKFMPIECERLQTLPDNYTEGCSNTQRYKMIGNAWTVDVIAHILGFLPDEYKF